MILVKTLFLTLLFYLLFTSLGFRGIREKQKARFAIFLNKVKLFRDIEVLIKSSAMDMRMPFFNTYSFLTISCAAFFAIFFFSYQIMKSIVPAVCCGLISSLIPLLALKLLRIYNIRRVRKNYHGFLCSLAGFYSLSGDIVGAYRNAADYTGEPLKTYVKEAVYKYDRSNVNFTVCLDELMDRVGERELIKFLKFTKLYLLHGGDYGIMLDKLNTQSQRMESSRLSLYSSAYVGIIAIAIMTFVDIACLASLFKIDDNAAYVLSSTLMGNGLILLNLLAVVFGVFTSFRLFKGGAY